MSEEQITTRNWRKAMAVNQTATPEENEEVDINDSGLLEGSEQEIDTKEDWQSRAAPPPKGRYRIKLAMEDTKFEKGVKRGFKTDDPNGVYYSKQLVGRIQDPTGKWQDSVVYYRISTGIPKGKKISSLAGLLVMLRVKVPAKYTDLKYAKLAAAAFAKFAEADGPEIIADCDWQAWDRDDVRKGKEFGSVATIAATKKLANTMDNFPKNPDGSYQHIVKTPKGAEVIASLKIMKLYPVQASPVNGAVKATTQPKPQAVTPEPKPTQALPVQVDAGTVGSVEMDADGEVVIDV